MKLLLELGPLIAFFLVNRFAGMEWAVGIFIGLTLVAVGLLRRMHGKWPMMPLVAAVFVTTFGLLTLWSGDETYIQLKPTAFALVAGGALLLGLARGRYLIREMFDGAFDLTEQGWRSLTLRFALFFLALAALNEALRLTLTWDQWVLFKSFGILPLTFVFTLAQVGLIQRESLEDEA